MKNKANIRLTLSDSEKGELRRQKIKISEILIFAVDELEIILDTNTERATNIYALAEFQTVPSIGLKFAENL